MKLCDLYSTRSTLWTTYRSQNNDSTLENESRSWNVLSYGEMSISAQPTGNMVEKRYSQTALLWRADIIHSKDLKHSKNPIYRPESAAPQCCRVMVSHPKNNQASDMAQDANADMGPPYNPKGVFGWTSLACRATSVYINLFKWSSQVLSGLIFSVSQFITAHRFQSCCSWERTQTVQTWRQRRCRTYFEIPPWGERDHLCSATNFDAIEENWCPNLAWAWWTTIIHGIFERLYWPVESESMKEGWKSLHHQQDGHSEDSKQTKNRHQEHNAHTSVHTKADPHHHCPQDFRELWITTKPVYESYSSHFYDQLVLDWLLQVSIILDAWI